MCDVSVSQDRRERERHKPVTIILSNYSNCGMKNPTWSEIHHFVKFLDLQLQSCENCIFTDPSYTQDVLSGFKEFVVRFMIRMSRVSIILHIVSFT